MPALDLRAIQRQRDFVLDTLRRIHRQVLPGARACLNRSDALLNASTGRQLEATQRLLDPCSNSANARASIDRPSLDRRLSRDRQPRIAYGSFGWTRPAP